MSNEACQKQDIILADCESEELEELVNGLNDVLGTNLVIETCIANGGHSKIYNLWRYLVYAFFPVRFFINRKKYRYIICWQQFYALFFCLYCRVFHVHNINYVVACNYTYKPKRIIEKIYFNFFKNNTRCVYMYKIHVPSHSYAKQCSKMMGINEDKIAVTPFGLPDSSANWKDSKVEYKSYSLAIGRSNRDFEFLINAWRNVDSRFKLLIISDTYRPKNVLPKNVIHRTDISGDAQFPYIINSDLMIIPIEDGSICSGDTVLLKAMSYSKPVVVTSPSVLGEMYIDDELNGLLLEKEPKSFAKRIMELLSNDEKMLYLSNNARTKYEKYYSRYSMGVNLGEKIKIDKE